MKPPAAPPPLTDMAARKAKLEADRAAAFASVKAALEEHDGCVTYAAAALGWTRAKVESIVRRHKLGAWAAELRTAATGHAGGRQDR